MKKNLNRRQFLRGAGGATLAIPFLPSLLRDARAQNSTNPKYFFAIGNYHGSVSGSAMFPDASLLTDTVNYAGRTVHYGDLVATVADGKRQLSSILRADENILTEDLLGKFNVIRGLDVPWYLGHHKALLGNYQGSVKFYRTTASQVSIGDQQCPTIDQVLAWSDSFYPDVSQITQRSVQIGSLGISHNYQSPSTKTGGMIYMNSLGLGNSLNYSLFDYFFAPGKAMSGLDSFLIDGVLEQYNRVRQFSRISAMDRARLDQHMELIYEIERKIAAIPSNLPDKTLLDDSKTYSNNHSWPHNPEYQAIHAGLVNDMLVAAMSAGVCRVGTLSNDDFYNFTEKLIGSYHNDVGHGGVDNDFVTSINQGTFAHIMVDLAAKMDAITMGNGTTLLDNALIMMTNENSQATHETMSIPVITAGGAGGFFNTGTFIDYRNPDVVYDALDGYPTCDPDQPGLTYNQFLGTVLQSMGLAPSEYENDIDIRTGAPVGGYGGFHMVKNAYAADYIEAEAVMSEPLPIIT